MRDMAGHGEHQIMMRRVHNLDLRADPFPEARNARHGGRIGPLGRCQDAPALVEQRGKASLGPAALGPRHRMRGDNGMVRQGEGKGSGHCRF